MTATTSLPDTIAQDSLLALNVVNPEALVARYNLTATQQTQPFDPDDVVNPSADAVPVIAEAPPEMDAGAHKPVQERLCGDPLLYGSGFDRAEPGQTSPPTRSASTSLHRLSAGGDETQN